MTADLVKTERADPLRLVELAIEKGISPADMAGLYDLCKRHDEDMARKEFGLAMKSCQEEMRDVKYDAYNNHTKSGYTRFETLNTLIRPIYTKHGFSLSFSQVEGAADGDSRLKLDVTHTSGHVHSVWADFPLDGIGAKGGATAMNAIQGKRSTVSYARRTLVEMAFNIAEGAEDRDGEGGGTISKTQLEELALLVKAVIGNPQKFYEWLQVKTGADSLDVLPSSKFDEVKAQLVLWGQKQKANGGPKS